jgi:hypothetical protein
MEITKYGIRMKAWLPVTLDSMLVIDRSKLTIEEVLPGQYFIAKPPGAYGPLWKRLYHAYLVLTKRGMVVQFTRDHMSMAGQQMADAGNIAPRPAQKTSPGIRRSQPCEEPISRSESSSDPQ